MDAINISSWENFEKTISDIKGKYDSNSPFLFRGLADSTWKLKTTLERKINKNISLSKYFKFVTVVKSKIESVTGKNWKIPTLEEYDNWIGNCRQDMLRGFPASEYFAYLRHHGFPSPLLDWSKSPYVAAYFAMINPLECQNGCASDNVSIFVCLASKSGCMIWDNQSHGINYLSSYLKTHKRHYLQQSTYTICTYYENAQWFYGNHEEVFSTENKGQDIIWKLDIPKSLRKEFLVKIEAMNINSFSLFQTEDGLMEHIYISEMYLGENL